MSLVNLEVKYPHGNSFRLVDRKPEGQKFGIGDLVYIIPITDKCMSHFDCDLITTVRHSYNQAHGNGGGSPEYSLGVAAWYNECQLILANGKTIEQCRSECFVETGKTYNELIKERAGMISTSIKTDADLIMAKAFNDAMSNICYETLSVKLDSLVRNGDFKSHVVGEWIHSENDKG